MDREFLDWLDEHPAASLKDAYDAGGEAGYKRGMDDGILRDDAWIAPVENPYRAPPRLSRPILITSIVVLALVTIAAMTDIEFRYLLGGAPADPLSFVLVALIIGAVGGIYLAARRWSR